MSLKLIDYLPFEYKKINEFVEICKAETPEFNELSDLANSVLGEGFLHSASEYGVSRLEYIAGIVPEEDETLEDRKFRLNVRYQFKLPYTLITLIERLDSICGKGQYMLDIINNEYKIIIDTRLKSSGQYDELLFLLENIIPANMLIISTNTLRDDLNLNLFYGSVFTEHKSYTIK